MNDESKKMEWEEVAETPCDAFSGMAGTEIIQRLEVPNGWIYRFNGGACFVPRQSSCKNCGGMHYCQCEPGDFPNVFTTRFDTSK